MVSGVTLRFELKHARAVETRQLKGRNAHARGASVDQHVVALLRLRDQHDGLEGCGRGIVTVSARGRRTAMARHAPVRKFSGMLAASSQLRCAGLGITFVSGRRMYSAYAPYDITGSVSTSTAKAVTAAAAAATTATVVADVPVYSRPVRAQSPRRRL